LCAAEREPQINIIFSAENATCTAWSKSADNKLVRQQYEIWARGFASGYNYALPSRQVKVGAFPSGDDLYKYFDQFCRDHPQQSFVAAFSALARYDGARPFRVWVVRIAINKCRDWARRRAVRRLFALALPIEAARDIADEAATPEALLADRQQLGRTMAAIAALPAALKEALVLRTIEGLSQADTALMLGISEKAIETRVYRARTKLVEALRD